jgi:hypothetical protein
MTNSIITFNNTDNLLFKNMPVTFSGLLSHLFRDVDVAWYWYMFVLMLTGCIIIDKYNNLKEILTQTKKETDYWKINYQQQFARNKNLERELIKTKTELNISSDKIRQLKSSLEVNIEKYSIEVKQLEKTLQNIYTDNLIINKDKQNIISAHFYEILTLLPEYSFDIVNKLVEIKNDIGLNICLDSFRTDARNNKKPKFSLDNFGYYKDDIENDPEHSDCAETDTYENTVKNKPPKPPVDAFLHFGLESADQIKKAYPGLRSREKLNKLKELWNIECKDEEKKKRWENIASADHKRYVKEMEEYLKKPTIMTRSISRILQSSSVNSTPFINDCLKRKL